MADKPKEIADSHLSVPGHDGKFGFGGVCFPKDTVGFRRVLNTLDVPSEVLGGVIKGNNKVRDKVIGVTAGSFDLLHAGHIKLLEAPEMIVLSTIRIYQAHLEAEDEAALLDAVVELQW